MKELKSILDYCVENNIVQIVVKTKLSDEEVERTLNSDEKYKNVKFDDVDLDCNDYNYISFYL